MNFTIEQYNPSLKEEWDIFVRNAKNATFLFLRDYMDYHADRFEDFSLIVRNDKGHIVALLPANREGELLVSHRGLTYGGWIGNYKNFNIISLLDIQKATNKFLIESGFKELIYKPLPFIYTDIPSQEDLYMLFRFGAERIGSQISSVVNLHTDAGPDYERRRNARMARQTGVIIEKADDFAPYWQILTDLLKAKYCAKPVHSLEEISRLHAIFPDNIQLYTASLDGELLAGTVVYVYGKTVHSQYVASTERGKKLSAVVFLHQHVMELFRAQYFQWYDFGTSNEQGGAVLNEGLAAQKIRLGGRGVTYDIYKMQLKPC